MNDNDDNLADSIFTYDPSQIINAWAILLNPGKAAFRKKEVE